MDKKLLEILVCPECKGPLVLHQFEDAEELVCRHERLAYPVRDKVPVMLAEEARVLQDDEVVE